MCNNNGACRALAGGVMCPSYRVTRDERDVTRGRANTLRLAITGQLGPDALTSDAMAETLKLCVSCKACRRECPTGVDMARMKIEVLAPRATKRGLSLHDRLVGYLPRYAPIAARSRGCSICATRFRARAQLSEARRRLQRAAEPAEVALGLVRRNCDRRHNRQGTGRDVVLFADTFNRYFERGESRRRAHGARRRRLSRHGRNAARRSRARSAAAARFSPSARSMRRATKSNARSPRWRRSPRRDTPIIGLEPSCLFSFRDEIPVAAQERDGQQVASHALLFEEFLAREAAAGQLNLPLAPREQRALLHGHCHQKSFDAMPAVTSGAAASFRELEVETIESSCCGMAGLSAITPTPSTCRAPWASCRCLPAVRKAPD